jgi:hypothetical protein
MDVAAWQCAGHWRCGAYSPLPTMLLDGWFDERANRRLHRTLRRRPIASWRRTPAANSLNAMRTA